MKMIRTFILAVLLYNFLTPCDVRAQSKENTTSVTSAKKTQYYIDVHHLGAGKVTAKDVAAAHSKDLAAEKKFGVSFLKYWVDEKRGDVYCLSTTTNPSLIRKTHAAAHGLLPDDIYSVTPGQASAEGASKTFYLDIHELGAGKVTAKDVAAAHQKDLAAEQQYGVNFINYWVNEKRGTVLCLSQAPDSAAVIKTHAQAHGLIPARVQKVVQGQ